jgi:hypothetical protein
MWRRRRVACRGGRAQALPLGRARYAAYASACAPCVQSDAFACWHFSICYSGATCCGCGWRCRTRGRYRPPLQHGAAACPCRPHTYTHVHTYTRHAHAHAHRRCCRWPVRPRAVQGPGLRALQKMLPCAQACLPPTQTRHARTPHTHTHTHTHTRHTRACHTQVRVSGGGQPRRHSCAGHAAVRAAGAAAPAGSMSTRSSLTSAPSRHAWCRAVDGLLPLVRIDDAAATAGGGVSARGGEGWRCAEQQWRLRASLEVVWVAGCVLYGGVCCTAVCAVRWCVLYGGVALGLRPTGKAAGGSCVLWKE